MNSLVSAAIYAIVGTVAITQSQPLVQRIEQWGQAVMAERDKNADALQNAFGIDCHDIRPGAEVSHPITAFDETAPASAPAYPTEQLPPVSAADIATAPAAPTAATSATDSTTPTGNGEMILVNYLNSQRHAAPATSAPAPANNTIILYQNPNS